MRLLALGFIGVFALALAVPALSQDKKDGEAKPRLEFTKGRTGTRVATPTARKHVPMEDVLAKMTGKIGERRRSAETQRSGRPRDEHDAGDSA